MTEELRTLVHVSTTEHDLDAAPADGRADEVAGDVVGASVGNGQDSGPVDTHVDTDDDLELDPADADVPARAQDIDIADDDDLDADLASNRDGDGADDDDDAVEDRLGSYDAFLAEAQADGFDGADPSYQLPMVVSATEVDDVVALADDREPDVAEPDVSEDVLEELRRANIDGPTVATLPYDDSIPVHRQLKRSPEYDPAPMPIPLTLPRMLGRKPRVRRVTRVVRHVDPWSVFKIAIVANLLIYVIVLVAGVLLWNVAYATGTVDNVERFFESFGWSSFEFNGGEIYHSGWTGGLFLVIGFTGLAVLAATMFNLITDLVGGMRFTVLEEEVVETRSSPMRRFVVRRSEPEIPLVSTDASGQIVREAVVDESTGYIRPR